MNYEGLVQTVAKKLSTYTMIVDKVLKTTLSTIKRTVKKDELVDLQNFGKFVPIFHDTWSQSHYDDWCRLNHIPHMPGVIGYAPNQWYHMEFRPSRDWKIWGEVDICHNGKVL